MTRARAKQSINNVYFGEKGAARIMSAINALRKDKDYVETKTRLIAELGYIKDPSTNVVVPMLKKIYGQTADTSIFQNEVLKALARHRSKDAIKLFKELVLQDPPFFESDYEYTGMFNNLRDSLELAATLYPEFLQLAGVDDYKGPVTSLLVTLVDSGFINDNQYGDYYNNLYFDARIELKKQQGKDEKKMEEDKDNDDDLVRNYDNSDNKNALNDYAILLMPFYDKNSNVPKYFDRLLRSKDELVRFNTAMLLMRKNINVPDSVLWTIAQADKWRGKLYSSLEEMKRLAKFPAAFKTQLQLARSYLVADKDYKSIDSIVYLSRQRSGYDNKKGLVYFFKYRVKKDDEWKIGLSGLQPEDTGQVSSDAKLPQ
jgi:hypothetical protein